MAEVASAFVSLLPSAKGFGRSTERQIGPQLNSAAKKTGSRFGRIFASSAASPLRTLGLAAVGLFAIKKVKDFFVNAISEAREAQKVSALTAQVIKSTGGAAGVSAKQVGQLATSISNMTGIDDEAIQNGANLLLTFTNLRNEAGKGNDVFNQATATITDMSAALGTDLKGSAIQVGKALNDPVKGITALTRVGVSFTQQQKDQIAALVASGNTLGAQKLILHELNREFGGAAAASSTAGEKLKTAFNNMAEAVGTKLLPYLDRAETALTALIISATVKTGPAFGDFKQKIMPVLVALQAFADTIKGLIENHLQPFLTVLSGLGGAALAQFSFLIGSTLVSALVGLVGALLSPIALIGFLVGAAIYAYTHFTGFKTAVDNAAASLVQFGGYVQTNVIPAVQKFGQWITTTAVPAVTSLAQTVGTNLKPVLTQLVTSFQTQVLPALQKFGAYLRQNGPEIKTIVTGLLQLTAAWIKVGTAVLGTVLPPLIRLQAFLAGKEIPVLGQLISIILKAGAAWITLGRDVSNAVQDSVAAVAKMVKAFQTGFAKITATIAAFPGKVTAILTGLAAQLYAMGLHAASELGRGIVDGFKQKIGEIAGAAAGIAGVIAAHLPGSPVKTGPLVSWNNGGAGKRLMELLAKGITDGAPTAVDAAQTAAQSIHDKVLAHLQDMRDKAKGILDGLKSDFASLKDSVASAFSTDLLSSVKTGHDLLTGSAVGLGKLHRLIAAFKKLRGMGLPASFLSQLFESGNSALIFDLARGPAGVAQTAADLFGQTSTLANQLGSQVAKNDIGPEMRKQTKLLEHLNEQVRHLAKDIGKEVNHAASNGHRRRAA